MTAKKDFLYNHKRNPLFRDDYRPSDYLIPTVDLKISLNREDTTVINQMTIQRRPGTAAKTPLILDGENMILKTLQIKDSKTGAFRDLDVSEYFITDQNLIIKNPPAGQFELKIETNINPAENTMLSGIYTAGDNVICSQCEAQGFRRITYFLDRPDVLATYTVTLDADKTECPVLLSNGNGDYKTTTDLGNGRHAVTWHDPHPKPSYLFAVVAGDLEVLEDTFTTMSGKKVDLRIFVEKGYEDKIQWAMDSTKRSMKWDEDRYGREYDLDCFHIVAVDKFNAGAMENKGLNVFNVKLLVGDPATSTDAELIDIEAVIGHEYFHNWTGDRVTLRDWFELTLKEGLTVLRDRQFTEDMHSKTIKRIEDAIELRVGQFVSDAGPTSHPILPERVEEFDNIYTSTIYTKGSHVLGMLHTMMGETTWRMAMDEYFNRFDGQAVACADFINVMEEVSGIDLTQFRRWYGQSGTPEITYEGKYDATNKTYTLTLTQKTPPTADQAIKQNLHIPVAVGLIGQSGKDIPLMLQGDDASIASTTTKILHLKEKTQTFTFVDIDGPVTPSILRGFSAPVKLKTTPSTDELIFRASYDSDLFNRYEAMERLMVTSIHNIIKNIENDEKIVFDKNVLVAYGLNLSRATEGDLAFNALMLQLPSYNIITDGLGVINPDTVSDAIDAFKTAISTIFEKEITDIYKSTKTPKNEKYEVNPAQVGRRQLHNLSLSYLRKLDNPKVLGFAMDQYAHSTNMTEKLSALTTLTKMSSAKDFSLTALAEFYNTYQNNNNIVDKWLSLNAGLNRPDLTKHLKDIVEHHPGFDITNPNKVRALMRGFFGNTTAFHNKDGSGYKFTADIIIQMNDINPRTAAGLSNIFTRYKEFDTERQALMINEMKRIMAVPTLDVGIKEIIGKTLDTVKTPVNDNKKSFGTSAKKKNNGPK